MVCSSCFVLKSIFLIFSLLERPETSAQVEGISGGAQRGFPTRVEALAHYHSEGRIGKVKIATE